MNIKVKLSDNYILATILSILILFVFFLNIHNQSSQSDNVYVTAQRLIYEQDYQKAQEMYENIISNNPLDPAAFLKISEIYALKGNYTEAINFLLKSSEGFTDNTLFLAQLPNYYYLSRNYEKAVETGYKYLSLKPDDSNVQTIIVNSLLVLSKYQQAADFLATYQDINLNEKNLFIKNILDLYYKKLTTTGTVTFKDNTINNLFLKIENNILDYQNSDKKIFASINITYELLQENYIELAKPFSEEIISLNNYLDFGYYYKGLILLKLGQFEESEKLFSKALDIKKDSTDYTVLLLASQIAQDKIDSVGITLLKLDKYLTESDKYKLSELLKLANDYKKTNLGLKIFQRYENYLNDDLVSLYLYIKFKALNNDYDNLLEDINQIYSESYYLNDVQKCVLLSIKGYVIAKTTNLKAGKELVIQALNLDTHSSFGYYYLAQINKLEKDNNSYNLNITEAKKFDYTNEFIYE